MHAEVDTIRFASGHQQLHGRLWHLTDETPATVVLLCGLGFHTFEYEPLATELNAAGVNAFSFDYRGHGRSPGPRGRWTLQELTADCRHALDYLQQRCPGPLAVYGNSLGAMIALLTGAQDTRPVGIVAANCPARIGDFLLTPPRRAMFAVAKAIEPVASVRISVNRFYSYGQLIDDAAWVATIQRDPLITDARRLAVRTLGELLDGWDGPAVARQLHRPLLVLQGRNDHLQTAEQSRRVFEAANQPAAYELLETGHLPHLESPSRLARLLATWLIDLTG